MVRAMLTWATARRLKSRQAKTSITVRTYSI